MEIEALILFDIDNTLAHTDPEPELLNYWDAHDGCTHAEASFHELWMGNHVLDAVRRVDDPVILSTWGKFAYNFLDAFDLEAGVIDYKDYTDSTGIIAKFEVIQTLGNNVKVWCDDQITVDQQLWCMEHDVLTIIPNLVLGLTLEQLLVL